MTRFLSSWILLFSLNAVSQSPQEAAERLSSTRAQIEVRAEETILANHLVEILKSGSVEEFLNQRTLLLETLRKNQVTAVFWTKRLDEKTKYLYLNNILDRYLSHSSNHFLKNYYIGVRSLLDVNRFDFDWLSYFYYLKADQDSRGYYFYRSNEINIDILPPDEFIITFTHELAHYFDDTLKKARSQNEELEKQYSRLPSNSASWSKDQQQVFGEYWFVHRMYLKYYKEAVPRLRACEIYDELLNKGIIKKPALRDQIRYEPVVSGRMTCSELVQKELSDYFDINYFWSKNQPEYQHLINYIRNWEREHGFSVPIYKN